MAKYIRPAVSVAVAATLSLVPVLSAPVGAASPSAARKFTSCTALLKVYKNGVAATKKAKGKTKAVVNATSYKVNKKLDIDADGIACDADDVKPESSSASNTNAKFATKTYEGSGDQTIKLAIPAGAVAIATITFDGPDGVTVSTFDAEEALVAMPVSSYGPYSGTVLLSRGDDAEVPLNVAALDIVGEGNWKVKISPATVAPLFDGDAAGSTDVVFRYTGSAIDIAATHAGEESFSVAVYDQNGILVERTLNEYGEVDDVYPMETGAYITVQATAAWTLAKA
jgi:hypothetical protein